MVAENTFHQLYLQIKENGLEMLRSLTEPEAQFVFDEVNNHGVIHIINNNDRPPSKNPEELIISHEIGLEFGQNSIPDTLVPLVRDCYGL